MNLPYYDNWRLEAPKVEYWNSFEEFVESLTDKQIDSLRYKYQDYLIENGVLDDDIADYDEDKFWEWVREEYYIGDKLL